MKQTVSKSMFIDAFSAIRPDNFSYEGLSALYEYFEAYENDTGEEIELDVIAICCEYSEDSIENALERYNVSDLDELRDNTQVIEVDDDNIIYLEY